MIIIYNKEKQKVQELVDKILQEHPEYGEVMVIGDLSELPEGLKISEVVDTATGVRIPEPDSKVISELVGTMTKHLEEVPSIEEFVEENKTEFQKLSSFNRKEKNQARRKLEHQALKYQNKHWKK